MGTLFAKKHNKTVHRQLVRRPVLSRLRSGLTLLEILLALSLTVMATALIGGLIQIYQTQFDVAKDNIRQTRLARALLTMIADDIRGVLRDYQNDDAATLEAFLTSSVAGNASGGGGGQTGGGGPGGGQGGVGGQSGASGQTATGSQATGGQSTGQAGGGAQMAGGGSSAGGLGTMSSGSSSTATGSDSSMSMTTTTALPPGLIGTDSIIEIDVSRPPRPDEYYSETKSLLESRIVDVPSDTKRVSYFVQAPQLYGVDDPLNQIAGADPMKNTGLVRRSLDRAVTRWATEQGQTQQLMTTGQILAPEVVALSFSYFDGLQWLTTWDSSVQGLPWAVQITIAMQHARYAREAPITPGTPLANLLMLPKTETGLETYSMLAVIPGVQLLKTPAEQSGTTDASASPTSSLGF